ILATARRVFAQSGFDDAGLDDIARAAGVSKPIIYRHFDGKRELYLAVLEEHVKDLIRRLWVALSAQQDPRERLRNGLEAYFAFVDEREDGFRMLVEAGSRNDPDTQARLGSAWDTLADGVARTVGDLLRGAGLDPAGAPIYARALIGMTESVAAWWLRTRRLPRGDLVDYLLALAWRGFDGLPRDPTHHHVG
ncbi:MAG TPA: TetR/AcrR family transcriptional regulator, partial [Actinomycetota bacterium]|nr:TetR/AcrR family transcriptional regulator [Actinomycetota bacterium]